MKIIFKINVKETDKADISHRKLMQFLDQYNFSNYKIGRQDNVFIITTEIEAQGYVEKLEAIKQHAINELAREIQSEIVAENLITTPAEKNKSSAPLVQASVKDFPKPAVPQPSPHNLDSPFPESSVLIVANSNIENVLHDQLKSLLAAHESYEITARQSNIFLVTLHCREESMLAFKELLADMDAVTSFRDASNSFSPLTIKPKPKKILFSRELIIKASENGHSTLNQIYKAISAYFSIDEVKKLELDNKRSSLTIKVGCNEESYTNFIIYLTGFDPEITFQESPVNDSPFSPPRNKFWSDSSSQADAKKMIDYFTTVKVQAKDYAQRDELKAKTLKIFDKQNIKCIRASLVTNETKKEAEFIFVVDLPKLMNLEDMVSLLNMELKGVGEVISDAKKVTKFQESTIHISRNSSVLFANKAKIPERIAIGNKPGLDDLLKDLKAKFGEAIQNPRSDKNGNLFFNLDGMEMIKATIKEAITAKGFVILAKGNLKQSLPKQASENLKSILGENFNEAGEEDLRGYLKLLFNLKPLLDKLDGAAISKFTTVDFSNQFKEILTALELLDQSLNENKEVIKEFFNFDSLIPTLRNVKTGLRNMQDSIEKGIDGAECILFCSKLKEKLQKIQNFMNSDLNIEKQGHFGYERI